MSKVCGFFSISEEDFELYDKILVWDVEGIFPIIQRKIQRNILVLSVENKLELCGEGQFVTYRYITEQELKNVCRLYHMYEFSDRFQIISRNEQFGSIWNYVDAGILTVPEAVEALMH